MVVFLSLLFFWYIKGMSPDFDPTPHLEVVFGCFSFGISFFYSFLDFV